MRELASPLTLCARGTHLRATRPSLAHRCPPSCRAVPRRRVSPSAPAPSPLRRPRASVLARASLTDDASHVVAPARGVALSLAACVSLATPAPALAGQPIEWVFTLDSGGQSIGDIVKDSLEESGIEVKRSAPAPAPAPRVEIGEDGVEREISPAPVAASVSNPEEPSEPVDVVGTAVKFGKLGVILVFADVVTFFVMGRSVLGVMDDGGEDGWKERVADQIMERAKKKAEGETETEGESRSDE